MTGNMKTMKIWSMACSALAILSVAGCNKAQTLPADGELKHFTIKANREAPTTKAGLEGMTPVFYAGDEICVWDGTYNNKFTTELGGAQAGFEGEALADKTYVIVSPYNERYTNLEKFTEGYLFGGASFVYHIPDVQVATPGSADPMALISLAKGITDLEGSPINLVNLVSLMKIEVPADLKVREIQVGGGAACNTGICGKTRYTYASGNFDIPYADQAPSVITVVPQAGEFIEAGTYYVAVTPREVSGGITIAYVNENYQLCKRSSSNGVTFAAGEIKNFGTLAANYTPVTGTAVLRPYGGNDDTVQFTASVKKLVNASATGLTDDTTITKIVFKAHTLFNGAAGTRVCSSYGSTSTQDIRAILKGTTVYVYTDAPVITLNATTGSLFRGFKALKEVTFNNLNTQANTTMEWMFRDCAALEKVDFGNADLSKVINMQTLMANNGKVKEVYFGNTATAANCNMTKMLKNCQGIQYLYFGPNFVVNQSNCLEMLSGTSTFVTSCDLRMSQAEYDKLVASPSTTGIDLSHFTFTPAN